MKPECAIGTSLSRDKPGKSGISMRGELKNPDTFESHPGQDFRKKVDDGYLEIAGAYGIPVVSVTGRLTKLIDII